MAKGHVRRAYQASQVQKSYYCNKCRARHIIGSKTYSEHIEYKCSGSEKPTHLF